MPTPSQQPTSDSKLGVLPTIILGIGVLWGLKLLFGALSGGLGNVIGRILMSVGVCAVFFILAMMLRDYQRGSQQLSGSAAMKVLLAPIALFLVGLVVTPAEPAVSDSASTTTSTVTTEVSTTVVSTTSRTHTPSPTTTKTSTTKSSTTRTSTSTSTTTSEPVEAVETVQHGFLYQEPSTEAPAPAPVQPAQQPAQQPAPAPAPAPAHVHYRNCREAKAAGAAPIYRGEPGYAPHLDRDGDGIACEK